MERKPLLFGVPVHTTHLPSHLWFFHVAASVANYLDVVIITVETCVTPGLVSRARNSKKFFVFAAKMKWRLNAVFEALIRCFARRFIIQTTSLLAFRRSRSGKGGISVAITVVDYSPVECTFVKKFAALSPEGTS